MPYRTIFKIRSGDTTTLTEDFTDKLTSGVALAASGHSVSAVEHYSGVTDNSILGSTTPTVSYPYASVVIHDVALGKRYDVTFTLTLNDATPSVITQPVLVIGVEDL